MDNTGLYYYGARYYDPTIARFITPDTYIQEPFDPQTLNRYTYCINNPLKYTDPTGHFFWFAVFMAAFFGAAMAASRGGGLGQILAGAFMGAWSTMSAGAVSNIIATAGGGAVSQAIGGAFLGSLISGAATGGRGRNLAQSVIISTFTAFAFAALGPAENTQAQGTTAENSQEIKQAQNVVSKETTGGGGGNLGKAGGAARKLAEEGIAPPKIEPPPSAESEALISGDSTFKDIFSTGSRVASIFKYKGLANSLTIASAPAGGNVGFFEAAGSWLGGKIGLGIGVAEGFKIGFGGGLLATAITGNPILWPTMTIGGAAAGGVAGSAVGSWFGKWAGRGIDLLLGSQ